MLAIDPQEVYGRSAWPVSIVISGAMSEHARAFQMAISSDRTDQSGNARHRQAGRCRNRREDARRGSQDLAAIEAEKERIARGIDIITEAIRNGGRIIFVGAGTSGRLGVLEAAEIPPTFGTDPDFVQAIIAGGKGAVFRAREGAEDNYQKGERSLGRLRPTGKDVVIGVSASGITQFVFGALTRARRAESKIILVTCDPKAELQSLVDLMASTSWPTAGARRACEPWREAGSTAPEKIRAGCPLGPGRS